MLHQRWGGITKLTGRKEDLYHRLPETRRSRGLSHSKPAAGSRQTSHLVALCVQSVQLELFMIGNNTMQGCPMAQITKASFFPASFAQRLVFEKFWSGIGATLLEGNEFPSDVYSDCIRRCRRGKKEKERKLGKARENGEVAVGKARSKTKRKHRLQAYTSPEDSEICLSSPATKTPHPLLSQLAKV